MVVLGLSCVAERWYARLVVAWGYAQEGGLHWMVDDNVVVVWVGFWSAMGVLRQGRASEMGCRESCMYTKVANI